MQRCCPAGLLACAVAVLTAQHALAQSRLPPCPGVYAAARWSDCYGTSMTNSGAIYRGEWRDDKFEGQGTYTYRNGARYVGQFSNNRRNGQGTFTYQDGATYVGGYKDDLRSGKGVFTFPDGSKFVGDYRDDRRNGAGVEYRADGTVLQSGIWENDVLVKRR